MGTQQGTKAAPARRGTAGTETRGRRRHLRAEPGREAAAARGVPSRAEPGRAQPGPAVSHRPGPGHHFPPFRQEPF